MFLFVCTPRELVEPPARRVAVSRDSVYSDLNEALSEATGNAVLVFDAGHVNREGSDELKLTIAEARNGVPYRRPVPVAAAGGYVVRDAHSRQRLTASRAKGTAMGIPKEVLLIFRRGVWDLPKGKLKKTESIAKAALREVGEEIGTQDLRIVEPLGTTVHGYPDGELYAVKTTHWFLMETSSTTFTPQEAEQIEEVRWVPWDEAMEMVGYDTLREHMASIRVRG